MRREVELKPLSGPEVWSGAQMQPRTDWIHVLTPAEVISVPIGERFFFDVDYQGITLTYGEARVFKATPVDLVTSWFSFRTWTWFGGTSPAPRTLSLLIRAG